MARELKDVSELEIVRVTVVNETPGSEREITLAEIPREIHRMGGHKVAAAMGYVEGDDR